MVIKEKAQNLFINTLPKKPYCTNKLSVGLKIWSKRHALDASYIQPNDPFTLHWMVIDIDQPNSSSLYQHCKLPQPNMIVINPENGHCHYYYKIKELYTGENSREKPQDYYQAIREAYIERLDADRAYVGLIAKNPISASWITLYLHAEEYSLGNLAKYVTLKRRYKRKVRDVRVGEGRNVELFDTVRFWAYEEKKRHTSFESLFVACLMRAQDKNKEGYSYAHGHLSDSEVQATAKSIAKWTWSCYRGEGKSHKNEGVMNLMDRSDLTVTDRQQLGALYAAEKKRRKTFEKLTQTARRAELGRDFKLNMTQSDIVKRSGLSLSTVKRYWQTLLEYIFKGVIRSSSDVSRGIPVSVGRMIDEKWGQFIGILERIFDGGENLSKKIAQKQESCRLL